ncbi:MULTISPECIES: four-helix bundle copper-binding protein [unclassified Salinibacterium]|uniref:four-helix bundle copper-binding protein n=1 Tax=unclassified Salinibacterium TaxID=2632331 RepID=UPI001422E5FB|nr:MULTISPECIES: four-helix bundle copper-binding protein [unclassified Salinibacterium]
MTVTRDMLDANPQEVADAAALATAIDACFECAAACTACADACLGEEMVADLVRCIRTDLDCADICAATGKVLTRQTAPDSNLLAAALAGCITACSTCADECESHADMHEHCRICGEACRRCQQACRDLLEDLE